MNKEKDTNAVLVSIRCTVYNHEKYIRKALDGFVMQKTDFRFEAIVHDDASTDGTAAIIREYADKYPDIIIPIYEKENQYSKHDGSLIRIMDAQMRGKYIAYCEGDDCWTDPLKLQKQVDFLEAHPDYVLSHTDFDKEDVNTGWRQHNTWKKQYNLNQIDHDWGEQLAGLLLQGKYTIQTLTVCVRNDMIVKARQNAQEVSNSGLLMGDTPLWIELSRLGKVHFLSDSTATYHIIGESATHSKNFSNVIRFYSSCIDMVDIFSYKYHLEKAAKETKQAYIHHLLKDIYMDKRVYLEEIDGMVVRGEKLNVYNSLLKRTISGPLFIKRIILFFVRSIYKFKHYAEFFVTKYTRRI
jgi:group 2 glycosyl transferase